MFGKRKAFNFSNMTHLGRLLLLMIIMVSSSNAQTQSDEENFLNIPFNQDVTVCELDALPANLNVNEHYSCTQTKLGDVDTQKKLILLSFEVEVSQSLANSSKPLGLFFFGKSAGQVYLNKTLIGNNGEPGVDSSEVPGAMDTVFYLPKNLLRPGANQFTLVLSAQHSLISLGNPLHFLGIAEYNSPQALIQSFSEIGLVLIGFFSLGAIYFSALWFYHKDRRAFALFALMCVIAAVQLGAEIYRGLVSYDYPIHDIRLLVVTSCSLAFGLCLLAYTTLICRAKYGWPVFSVSAMLTLSTVYFTPGFDFKSLLGMVTPLLCGLALTSIQAWRLRRTDLFHWAIAQGLFLLTSWLATALFHEFLYYLLVSGLLAFVFYQQAKDMALQQQQQQEDQKAIAKLEYQLAQIASHKATTKLEISIGGKTEMIDSNKITYCKAAGDYVELHLEDGSERLYSSTLKTLESTLPDTFLRVHRSYLVNLSYVTSLHSASNNQNARLELKNETFVDVSRRLLPSVRATLTSS